MNKSIIYHKLKPYIVGRIKKVDYLGITTEEIFSFLETEIKVEEEIDLDELKEKVNNFLLSQGEKKLLDEKSAFDIVKAYIAKRFKGHRTVDDALGNLEKLSLFFTQYNYLPNPDMMMKIIEENKKLWQSVERIFKEYREEFISGNGDEVLNDTNILFMIDCYCLINNIEKKFTPEIDFNGEGNITDSVAMYLREIGKYPLLTKEEESFLAYRVKEGDIKAKERLVECNLRLVVSITKRFRDRGMEFLDLIQEGNIGLMMAIDRFDVEKGFPLSVYAIWWIKQAVLRALYNKGNDIRIPVWKNQKISAYKKVRAQLKLEIGQDPTIEEVAAKLEIPVAEAIELDKLTLGVISLNTFVNHDKDSDNVDGVDEIELESSVSTRENTVDDRAILNLLPAQIDSLFQQAKLKPREKEIIILRYGLNGDKKWTFRELSERYHISDERVRQIELLGLKRLRMFNGIQLFADYTDDPSQSLENIENFKELYKDPANNKRVLFKEKKKTNKRKPSEHQELENTESQSLVKVVEPTTSKDEASVVEEEARVEKDLVIKDESPKGINATRLSKEAIDIEKQDYQKILDFLKMPTFQQMVDTLSAKEAIIVSLKLGYVDGKYFSTEAIANFLGIEKEGVLETMKRVLLLYKENINQAIDSVIEQESTSQRQKVKY